MINKELYFIVVKSFALDNQILVMKGDLLKLLKTEVCEDDPKRIYTDYYFEVTQSKMCQGLEINLCPNEIVERLELHTPVKRPLFGNGRPPVVR